MSRKGSLPEQLRVFCEGRNEKGQTNRQQRGSLRLQVLLCSNRRGRTQSSASGRRVPEVFGRLELTVQRQQKECPLKAAYFTNGISETGD